MRTALLLLLSAIGTGCTSGRALTDDGGGVVAGQIPATRCFGMRLDEFEAATRANALIGNDASCGFYPLFLRAADTWYLVDVPGDVESYQVVYIPFLGRPVVLKAWSDRSGTFVSAVRLAIAESGDAFEVNRSVSRPMTRSEWRTWQRKIENLRFWSDRSTPGADPPACMDADTFVFEGSRRGRNGPLGVVQHRIWHPYCPQGRLGERLWDATSYLFDITQTPSYVGRD